MHRSENFFLKTEVWDCSRKSSPTVRNANFKTFIFTVVYNL